MNEKSRSGKINLGNSALMPKEEHLETAVRFRKISIGLPCDIKMMRNGLPFSGSCSSAG
jgi:hypothetical protein